MQSTSKSLSARDCAWELLDAAPPLIWHIRTAMRRHRGGLSMPQFRAMTLIYNEPNVSLSAVADHLDLSLPTASRIVTGLVDRGFLKRKECAEDRRQCSLGITGRGLAVLTSAWSVAQSSMTELLAQVTPRQRAAVADAMKVVKQVFGSLGLPPDRSTNGAASHNGDGHLGR